MTAPTPSFNPQTELAKERNRVAAERTLLAWIRSGISLIGIGFGIDQVLQALYANFGNAAAPGLLIRLLNLAFIGLGTFAISAAIIDYRGELRRFRQPEYRYTPRLTIGLVVAPALIVLAIGAFLMIWLDKVA